MLKKIFYRIIRLFVIAAILFGITFFVAWISKVHSRYAAKPLRELTSFSIKEISCISFRKKLHVKYIDYAPFLTGMAKVCPIREKPSEAIFMKLLYDKNMDSFYIQITWKNPAFWGGKTTYLYALTSQEEIKDLQQFISDHDQLLKKIKIAPSIRCLLNDHKAELTRLGDGDPYVGLERAGVFEWVKEDKDPEAEWRKKYPAEKAVESQAK